jgi:hypothetical protein
LQFFQNKLQLLLTNYPQIIIPKLLFTKGSDLKMKSSFKKIALIGLSLCAFLPISLLEISNVKAESVTNNLLKQNQSIPYPINDPDVITYRNNCKERAISEGLSANDATQMCNCILNKLHTDYRYRNSRITLNNFRHLRRDAVNGNRVALGIMEDAGYDCLVEEGFLYQ